MFLLSNAVCSLRRHTVQVYPIGIPLLYASILWKNRVALNPPVQGNADSTSGGIRLLELGGFFRKESAEEVEKRLELRKQNPDLLPSMFLWKDFGERVRITCLYDFEHHIHLAPRGLCERLRAW